MLLEISVSGVAYPVYLCALSVSVVNLPQRSRVHGGARTIKVTSRHDIEANCFESDLSVMDGFK
jgi:hypothetical protein